MTLKIHPARVRSISIVRSTFPGRSGEGTQAHSHFFLEEDSNSHTSISSSSPNPLPTRTATEHRIHIAQVKHLRPPPRARSPLPRVPRVRPSSLPALVSSSGGSRIGLESTRCRHSCQGGRLLPRRAVNTPTPSRFTPAPPRSSCGPVSICRRRAIRWG